MQPKTPTVRAMADRFCDCWACLCVGMLIGFAAWVSLQTRGYGSLTAQFVFEAIMFPIGILVIVLPWTVLAIVRLVVRHRQLDV